MATSDTTSSRRPYHGSCDCGHTKYVVFLTFPPFIPTPPPSYTIRIGKCNCSTCHKMGLFHLWLKSAPDDFILLSPLDPQTGGLVDYTCFGGKIHWYFCNTCGVHCFGLRGTGEVAEVDEGSWGTEEGEGGKIKVWRPKQVESEDLYLSVNAMTLEAGQEGLDLKEWTEKNWIWYYNMKNGTGDPRIGEPHESGCY